MTVQRVSFLQNLGTVYTAEELRRFLKLLSNRQPGVNAAGDLLVAQNGTPNMSVNIAAGEALANGSETATQGIYYNYNDAVVNRTVAASDPTNPRKDLVVLRDRDQFYSTAFNDGDFVIVTGTPAPSPVDPTAPADSLTLARLAVAANATSITNANITDLRVWQAQKLVPGTAGWHLRDSGDANDNIGVTDAGLLTLRNGLLMPPSAGGTLAASSYGSTMVKIAEAVTSASQATVSFASIPQGFRHLMALVVGRGDTVGTGGDIYRTDLSLQFNGDTANNYAFQYQDDAVTTVTANQVSAAGSMSIGHVATASATANTPGSSRIEIPWYSGTTFIKQALGQSLRLDTGGTGNLRWGAWNNTAAINAIVFRLAIGSFVANSLVTLYGIP